MTEKSVERLVRAESVQLVAKKTKALKFACNYFFCTFVSNIIPDESADCSNSGGCDSDLVQKQLQQSKYCMYYLIS